MDTLHLKAIFVSCVILVESKSDKTVLLGDCNEYDLFVLVCQCNNLPDKQYVIL